MTTITIQRPLAVRAPRAAAWAAAAFLYVQSWFGRRAEESAVRHRAVDRAVEAAAVRAYALEVEAHDRGFAADLRAAADRHELDA